MAIAIGCLQASSKSFGVITFISVNKVVVAVVDTSKFDHRNEKKRLFLNSYINNRKRLKMNILVLVIVVVTTVDEGVVVVMIMPVVVKLAIAVVVLIT